MKILAFASLVLLTALLPSCTKKEVVIPNQTILTDINPNNWQYDNTTKTYYVAIDMPEIDENVNETDGVLVYISSGDQVYEALPEVYNGYSYTVLHAPGNITIEAQGADGSTVNPPNYPLHVKIVLVKSAP
jgi:hypothetical protein